MRKGVQSRSTGRPTVRATAAWPRRGQGVAGRSSLVTGHRMAALDRTRTLSADNLAEETFRQERWPERRRQFVIHRRQSAHVLVFRRHAAEPAALPTGQAKGQPCQDHQHARPASHYDSAGSVGPASRSISTNVSRPFSASNCQIKINKQPGPVTLNPGNRRRDLTTAHGLSRPHEIRTVSG
jgi:hypothetical protein